MNTCEYPLLCKQDISYHKKLKDHNDGGVPTHSYESIKYHCREIYYFTFTLLYEQCIVISSERKIYSKDR